MADPAEKIKAKKNGRLLSEISVLLSVMAGLLLTAFLIYLCAAGSIEVYQSRTDNTFTHIRNYTCEEVQRDDAPHRHCKGIYFYSG